MSSKDNHETKMLMASPTSKTTADEENSDYNTPKRVLPNKIPEDTGNKVYIITFIFGIGALMPWNTILSAFDYFYIQMVGYQPLTVYPFAVNSLVVVAQILMTLYGSDVSFNMRLIPTFLILAAIMIVMPFLASMSPAASFWSVFVVLLFYGLVSGVNQGSIFFMAGHLPPKYMGAVMFGNGISGIGSNILRAITLATLPDNEFLGALIFFIISGVFMVVCAVLQYYLNNNEFAQYYLQKKGEKEAGNINDSGRSSVITDSSGKQLNSSKIRGESQGLLDVDATEDRAPEDRIVDKEESNKPTFRQFLVQAKQNFNMAMGPLLALYTVFVVTFTVFPGATEWVELKMFKGLNNDSSWYILFMSTLFNVCDTIGRYVGGVPKLTPPNKVVFGLSYARVIFVVTFLLTDFEVGEAVFGADWFQILNMALFAFTNGYVSTMCAIKAPQNVPEESKGQVGAFVGNVISLGILTGAILAVFMGMILPDDTTF